ncbi:extensin family protein [Loktanella sp. IMCC34160]|uniref:extensin-like domain-containing protein n=1 Tax=Loktanella sp. IMCC34160 TaxID=2510646 RepID=UPI00101B8DA9|nr:extensin family protein [Loktanella sp. IMCC34160]RYG91842.1 extensin family protein [Loktanella sp. IMCC34160]
MRLTSVLVLLAAIAVSAAPVWADAPGRSLRPVARPLTAPADPTLPEARAERAIVALSPLAVARSYRPARRPTAIERRAEEARLARLRGQVCGDPDIQGEEIGTVSGAGACGVEGAVRVRSILGVRLSQRAVMDCTTARALKTWVARGAIPAVGNEGGGIAQLQVMGHYACRGRNNQQGARLSEHAFGRAVDVGGMTLRDGSQISVLRGWGTGDDGAQLRQMHRAACGTFGTVLGPEANAYHRDHFHFDTARYRSGSYCR